MKLHTFVQLLVFSRSIDRCVNRVKRNIDEPRSFLGFDPFYRLGGHEFRGVAFFVESFTIAVPRVFVRPDAVLVGPRIRGPGECAISGVETERVRTPLGLGTKVPLPGLVRGIAQRFQRGRECNRSQWHGPQVARSESVRTEPARISPAHQGGSRGCAHGLNVVLIELDAGLHEFVEVGSFAESIVPADVTPTEVVGDDEENVRQIFGLCGRKNCTTQDRGEDPTHDGLHEKTHGLAVG